MMKQPKGKFQPPRREKQAQEFGKKWPECHAMHRRRRRSTQEMADTRHRRYSLHTTTRRAYSPPAMRAPTTLHPEFEDKHPLRMVVRALCKAVCLPIVGVLLLLEPVVRLACGLLLVLGVFAAIVFELSAVGPWFPFLQVLGISLSFGVILVLYYFLISLFIKDYA